MSRSNGQLFTGTVTGNGSSGLISVQIGGELFSGPIIRGASGDKISIVNGYDFTGPFHAKVSVGNADHIVKGLLSSPSGKGLRCEFKSNGSTGEGVCQNDEGAIYDAIVIMK